MGEGSRESVLNGYSVSTWDNGRSPLGVVVTAPPHCEYT